MTENYTTLVVGAAKLRIYDRYAEPIVAAIRKGSYEGAERYVASKVLRPGDRVIEIGTATGLVAMTCAGIVGESAVSCFEANPQMCEDAKENFRDNDLNISITNGLLQNAIKFKGDAHTEKFFIDPAFWASNTTPSPDKLMVEVPCYCLEERVSQFQANVLVCDIEGGEVELFTDSTLPGIQKVIMEVHYWVGRGKINLMLQSLFSNGFLPDFDLCSPNVIALHRGVERPY